MDKTQIIQIRTELKELSARRRDVIRETQATIRTAESDDLARAKDMRKTASKARRDAIALDAKADKIETACMKRRKALTSALERRLDGAERRKQILLGRLANARKPVAKPKGGKAK